MIKKHFITCSVITVLAFIFTLNICATTVGMSAKKSRLNATRFIFTKNDATTNYSFANEAVPVNNAAVSRKLQHSLKQHGYRNIQSHLLHLKAERLFPVIEPILQIYGIPDDFKYLAMVESGLDGGKSTRGAVGIWQFMPGTARTYGLRVGHGVDERLNLQKSTVAACKYLKELYGEFNSWTLAAAAYNNGEIKLARAMRKQSEGNYFRMHLNRETGAYVYNIVAMKEIIARPGKYGYNKLYAYVPPERLAAYN